MSNMKNHDLNIGSKDFMKPRLDTSGQVLNRSVLGPSEFYSEVQEKKSKDRNILIPGVAGGVNEITQSIQNVPGSAAHLDFFTPQNIRTPTANTN